MPRDLPSPMLDEIGSNSLAPCFLIDITLVSGVAHIWSGIGSLVWNGNTYLGVGSLGAVGEVLEGSYLRAAGTTISLSGIDPTLLSDTLNDIKMGAPATVWLGTFANGALEGAYPLFVGCVDRPAFPVGPDSFTIVLALESRLTNLQRASMRRYTTADQRYYHPDDTGFFYVETLCDVAVIWG